MKDTRDMMVKDYDTCTDEERCTWWAEITRI